MIRSTYSHAAFAAKIVIAASLTLVIVFAAAALRPQMSALVPVTGPQAASAAAMRNLDLGAGYTLVTNANGTHIVAPEAPVKSAPVSQTLDLGAGYILRDGQIIAPARPDTSVRRTDLGAGYTLVTNAGNSQIVAPASSLKTAPVTSQTLDLGAGYTLRDGQIVAPVSNLKAAPAASQKIDLGAGYTLRDGQIVAPASNLKAAPAASQKIDLGGGYWLVLTDSEGQIVTEGSRNR